MVDCKEILSFYFNDYIADEQLILCLNNLCFTLCIYIYARKHHIDELNQIILI